VAVRLGLVGVGRWGRILASKFQELGAAVACHDRGNGDAPTQGLGQRVAWRDMLGQVDAVVLAAPPSINFEVALRAAERGLPIFCTKPVGLTAGQARQLRDVRKAPFIVDYVHSRSRIFQRMKRVLSGTEPTDVSISMYGDGPERAFPPLWDYGPHALSILFALYPNIPFEIGSATTRRNGNRARHYVGGMVRGARVSLVFGNNSSETMRRVLAYSPTVSKLDGPSLHVAYEERLGGEVELLVANIPIVREHHDPLKDLAQDFLDAPKFRDVGASWNHLDVSVRIAETLDEIAAHE